MTERANPYRTVLEVGATLTASLELDEVFATIARQVGTALGVQWCDINEYDPVARTMTYVAVWSEALRDEDLAYLGTVVSLDERPERDEAIRRGDIVEAYLDDPDLDPAERASMERYDEKATMEVPLVYGDEPIGLLGVVESRRARRFTDEEKHLLRLLALPAAAAIGNARAFRAQRARTRRTAALLDSSRVLAATVDLDEVLARVARCVVEIVDGSESAIYEYRPETDSIIYRAVCRRHESSRAAPDDDLGTAYPLSDYPGERAILAGAEVVQELRSDPDLAAARRASMDQWDEGTCVSVPLRFGGSTVGILRLHDREQERLRDRGELELLTALGELAGSAIHNARLFREQGDHSERLLGLFETSRSLAGTFDTARVAAVVEAGARRVYGADPAVEVWLSSADGGFVPAAGVERAVTAGGATALRDLPAVAAEALACGKPQQTSSDEVSELAMPLIAKGNSEGVLLLRSAGRRLALDAEVEALQVLANHAAAALENARLYRRVEQQAIRDGLTSLYNHRYFQERLAQECARARRYELPLSLLMLDLDGFKAFNDRFGHQLGDEALREVGEVLSAATRRGVDLAARYGGEEFAVILPHTAVKGGVPGDAVREAEGEGLPAAGRDACVVAERLRAAIEERAFAGHGGRRSAHLTATIGVAGLGLPDGTAKDLIAAADAALYAGKRAGRNRVEAAACRRGP